ncbi:MAG: cyclase family protein [Steroidobacteraceae bacterium]
MTLAARWQAGEDSWRAPLDAPVSLAIALHFDAPGVRHFGAPAPATRPLDAGGFHGDVAHGGSCNCRSITLIPHCHGTHTECIGHLTAAAVHAWRVAPLTLQPSLLLSVPLQVARDCHETCGPPSQPDDLLVTRAALDAALARLPPMARGFSTTAIVIRTLPNDATKHVRDYSAGDAPYLTLDAVRWLLERDTRHLVLDLPSLDRSHDAGELSGHRLFFGLPARDAGSNRKDTVPGAGGRADCTITELAFVPDVATDGPALLQLTLPAIDGDAVPSRPLLYPLAPA